MNYLLLLDDMRPTLVCVRCFSGSSIGKACLVAKGCLWPPSGCEVFCFSLVFVSNSCGIPAQMENIFELYNL